MFFLAVVVTVLKSEYTIDVSLILGLLWWVAPRDAPVYFMGYVVLFSLASLFVQWYGAWVPPSSRSLANAQWSEWWQNALLKYYPEGAYNAFIRGVWAADKRSISPEVVDHFKVLGISHLLAVSGFHVGVLVKLISPIQKVSGMRVWRWCALVCICGLLGVYASTVGASASILRAVLMYTLFSLGKGLGVVFRSLTIMSMAGIAIWLFDPMMVKGLSFQLSFAAVTGILLVLDKKSTGLFLGYELVGKTWGQKVLHLLRANAVISMAAWAATAPIVSVHFGGASPWFLLGNLLLVPVFAAFMWAGLVTALLGMIPIKPLEPAVIAWANTLANVYQYWIEFVQWVALWLGG